MASYKNSYEMIKYDEKVVTIKEKRIPLSSVDFIYAAGGLVIDLLYVFKIQLDAEKLKSSLSKLLEHYPHISGRYFSRMHYAFPRGVELNNHGCGFRISSERKKSIAEVITKRHQRGKYIDLQVSHLARYGQTYSLVHGSLPLMTIKLTQFTDGCTLGVCVSHGVFDGDGLIAFVKNWSTLFRGEKMEEEPCFDCKVLPHQGYHDVNQHFPEPELSSLNVARGANSNGASLVPFGENKSSATIAAAASGGGAGDDAGGLKKKKNQRKTPRRKAREIVRVASGNMSPVDGLQLVRQVGGDFLFNGLIFHDRSAPVWFSQETLVNMKNTMEKELNASCGTSFITTNEALTAHLAVCVELLLKYKVGSEFGTVTLMNWRGRVEGVPKSYTANAISIRQTSRFKVGEEVQDDKLKQRRGELDELLLKRIAICKQINDCLRQYAQEPSSPALTDACRLDLFANHHRVSSYDWKVNQLLKKNPAFLWTNNFSKYPLYQADFGHPAGLVLVVPQVTVDQIVIFPAPPAIGGVYCYFQAQHARAIRRLKKGDDLFWKEMNRFLAPTASSSSGAAANADIHGPNPLNPTENLCKTLSPF